jgi:hypothetical protein
VEEEKKRRRFSLGDEGNCRIGGKSGYIFETGEAAFCVRVCVYFWGVRLGSFRTTLFQRVMEPAKVRVATRSHPIVPLLLVDLCHFALALTSFSHTPFRITTWERGNREEAL